MACRHMQPDQMAGKIVKARYRKLGQDIRATQKTQSECLGTNYLWLGARSTAEIRLIDYGEGGGRNGLGFAFCANFGIRTNLRTISSVRNRGKKRDLCHPRPQSNQSSTNLSECITRSPIPAVARSSVLLITLSSAWALRKTRTPAGFLG